MVRLLAARNIVMSQYVQKCVMDTVAYLECVKGGGPGGLGTEVPQWGPGAKPQ